MQVELLPQASVATEVTVVVPTGNDEPEAGVLTTVTAPEQLSVAVTVKLTTATQALEGVATEMLAGQVIVGAVTSFTVIIWVQSVVLPAASFAR